MSSIKKSLAEKSPREKNKEKEAETAQKKQRGEEHLRFVQSKEKQKKAKNKINPEEKGSLLGTLTKAVLSAVTTNIIVSTVTDAVVAAKSGVSLDTNPKFPDKLSSVEGKIIKGPAQGGALLDRPMAGAIADVASKQSMNLDYNSGAATKITGKGLLVADGEPIKVADHIPGSTAAKVVMGNVVNPSEALGTLTETAVNEQESRATNKPTALEQAVQVVTLGGQTAQLAASAITGMQIGSARKEWKKEAEQALENKTKNIPTANASENNLHPTDPEKIKVAVSSEDDKVKTLKNNLEIEAYYRSIENDQTGIEFKQK